MGFSSDPNIAMDMSMIWTDQASDYPRALAYNIFKELTDRYDDQGNVVASGGIKYFDVLYPATNYLTSKLLILESTQYINHLASATVPETWRIAFEITGYPEPNSSGGTTFIGTTLKAYIGTKTTIYPDPIIADTWYYKINTVEVVLVEGGATQTSKRISESNLYSYRVSIAGDSNIANKKRGLVVACWETFKIEQDMKYFGFFCIQRPVGPTGQPNDAGTTPVICIHNTQSINGTPKLSSNFYYSVVREKFIEVPTKGTEVTSEAHSSLTLNFMYKNMAPGEQWNINPDFVFTGDGKTAYIRLGSNFPGSPTSNRISADNKVGVTVYSSFENDPEKNAKALYDIMKNYQDIGFFNENMIFQAPQRVAYFDASATPPAFKEAWQIRIINTKAGEGGNNFYIKYSPSPALQIQGNKVGSDTFFFQGGGTTSTRAFATIRFNQVPYVDPLGNTLNNDAVTINGVRFTFVDANQTPAQRQVRVGTGNFAIKDTINNLINEILRYRHPDTLKANYYYSNTPKLSITGWDVGSDYLVVEYNEPGIHGNDFSIKLDTQFTRNPSGTGSTGGSPPFTPTIQIQPNGMLTPGTNQSAGDGVPYDSLIRGTGWFEYGANATLTTEISDPLQRHGNMIYPFPKNWDAPVTTDHDEYVLEFPFGFCTDKLAFTEEVDMIAVSKGMAYQARQDVPITVYGENRVYTALAINKQDYPSNPIRFFILTQGGNTKPIA